MRRSLRRRGGGSGGSGGASGGARAGGALASGALASGALAPLVDVFTLLLVVLLRTWSTQPPLSLAEAQARLPVSRSEDAVHAGVIVDIGPTGLWVEGERAGSVAWVQGSDQVLIPEVYQALQARAGRRVEIRADAATPWQVLGKVLFTAQQAGYAEVELVAQSNSSL